MKKKISEYNGHIVEKHDGKHYDRTNSEQYEREIDEEVPNKECVKCGEKKPATADNFYRDKYRAGGLMPICKECKRKEYQEKKTNLKKKDSIIINPEGIEVGIKISDEGKLMNFAKDFLKFLESNPKISYNLHDTIREIQKQFKLLIG